MTWDERALGGFDVIVLQRWMYSDLAYAIGLAVASGQVIVNDVDDYFWGLDPRNQAARVTDPLLFPELNRDHYLDILKASSLCTVSTPYLRDRLHELGVERTHVIRNGIDLDQWRTHPVDREPPTVGWVGALPWRSGDVEELRGVMGSFLRDHPDVGFHHGGHVDGWSIEAALGLTPAEGERVRRMPMAAAAFYPRLWNPLDFSVIPLSPQPFNYAKSNIKGLEAAASGVPFIASATPEYEWLAAEHGIGRVAHRRKDWVRELRHLLDPAERERQAKENRAAVGPLDAANVVLQYESCYESLT